MPASEAVTVSDAPAPAVAVPPVRSSGGVAAWLRFLRSELRLILSRRRNQAGLGVLAALPIVMAIAVKLAAPDA